MKIVLTFESSVLADLFVTGYSALCHLDVEWLAPEFLGYDDDPGLDHNRDTSSCSQFPYIHRLILYTPVAGLLDLCVCARARALLPLCEPASLCTMQLVSGFVATRE